MKKSWLVLAVAVWLGMVGIGAKVVHAYQADTGVTHAPTVWPSISKIAHRANRPIVVLFVHGDSRANVSEFYALQRDVGRVADFTVVQDREEDARFGAKSSGHVVVYDAVGRLRFDAAIDRLAVGRAITSL